MPGYWCYLYSEIHRTIILSNELSSEGDKNASITFDGRNHYLDARSGYQSVRIRLKGIKVPPDVGESFLIKTVKQALSSKKKKTIK